MTMTVIYNKNIFVDKILSDCIYFHVQDLNTKKNRYFLLEEDAYPNYRTYRVFILSNKKINIFKKVYRSIQKFFGKEFNLIDDLKRTLTYSVCTDNLNIYSFLKCDSTVTEIKDIASLNSMYLDSKLDISDMNRIIYQFLKLHDRNNFLKTIYLYTSSEDYSVKELDLNLEELRLLDDYFLKKEKELNSKIKEIEEKLNKAKGLP